MVAGCFLFLKKTAVLLCKIFSPGNSDNFEKNFARYCYFFPQGLQFSVKHGMINIAKSFNFKQKRSIHYD